MQIFLENNKILFHIRLFLFQTNSKFFRYAPPFTTDIRKKPVVFSVISFFYLQGLSPTTSMLTHQIDLLMIYDANWLAGEANAAKITVNVWDFGPLGTGVTKTKTLENEDLRPKTRLSLRDYEK